MSLNPLGGPHTVDELRRIYPQLGGVALDIRKKCIESPLFLMSKILCGARETNLLETPSEGHREVERAMIAFENILYVDHRGTLKTTVLDEGGSVWELLFDPEIRTLFLQSNAENAKMMSRQIRGHFKTNRALRALFPEYEINTGDDGNVLSWSVPCKRTVTLEGSFNVATPGVSTTGLHFDTIRASDLMNPETVPPPCGRATPETMKSIIAWYATTDGLLVTKNINPRAHRTIDSNRWCDADHVGQILRDDPKQPEQGGYFRKIIRGVKRGADGRFIPTWPEGIPSEELHAIHDRPTMTPALWASNYQSDPLPEGGMAFKREAIHTYGDTDSPKLCQCNARHRLPDDLEIATTVDPAFTDQSAKKAYKSDRSGIITSGVARSNKHLYVLDARAGRWEAMQLIEAIFETCAFWKPMWVGIEDIAAGLALKSVFLSEMLRSGRMVPYRDIRMPGANRVSSKEARIFPLHAHVHRWGLYVHEDGRHDALVDELLRFGVGEHDDLADALGMRGVDLYAGAADEKKEERPMLRMLPKFKFPERRKTGSVRPWDRAKKHIG